MAHYQDSLQSMDSIVGDAITLKALCSSHDYKCDYKQGRNLHGKFLSVFHVLMPEYYYSFKYI